MKLNLVPASTGITWVKLGIQTFLRQPLALAGLFFMYMAVVVVVSQVPVAGPVLAGLLVPAATLGLMAASSEATKGRFPMPTVLVSAFRAGKQRATAMLMLGAVYTVLSFAATHLAILAAGSGPASTPAAQQAQEFEPAVLLGLVFHLPVFMMFWHAPALVHWHGVTPAKSLFFSVVACLRNFGAFLIYSLGWLAVFLGAGTAFGLVGHLLGGPGMARAIMMPAALLLAAMFSTSIYFTFRDSFAATPGPDTNPHPGETP